MEIRSLGELAGYSAGTKFNSDFKINFEFGAKRFVGLRLKEEIERFSSFVVQLLEIDSTKSKYSELNIFFKRPRNDEEIGLDAKFIDGDRAGTVWIYVREVIYDVKLFLETIAHEMVHAKQFCDKRLSKIFKRQEDGEVVGCYSWSESSSLYYDDDIQDEYVNLPWEVEANTLQAQIVGNYMDFLKETRKTTLLFQPVPL